MRRRAFTFLAGISAVIFLLAAGFWVRGLFAGDTFTARSINAGSGRDVQQSIFIGYGRVTYLQYRQILPPNELVKLQGDFNQPWTHSAMPSYASTRSHGDWLWIKFRYIPMGSANAPVMGEFRAEANLLVLIALYAILPGLWTIQFFRRRRRNRPGCCPTCGYDLRATPEQGGALLDRCPECGAIATAEQPTRSISRA